MNSFLIHQNDVPDWMRQMAQGSLVYFPQHVSNAGFQFAPVQKNSEIQFAEYHPTVVPPGKKLAPADEPLFRYHKSTDREPQLEPVFDQTLRILAGVRPCDLQGIALLDQVNRQGCGDPHYLTRRANTILIGYDCLQPCDGRCFCAATGSLRWRANADLFLTPGDDGQILAECFTEQGQQCIHEGLFSPCDDADARKAHAESRRPQPFGRSFHAGLEGIRRAVADAWHSPVWEKQVAHCFSCGSCNLVCPTCYCFDVRDDFDLANPQTGQRTRTWDGCMLPDFAAVAGGHNFRPAPAARQRHRVKRKFAYLTERFSASSFCTGCGRCGRQCTVGIDIFDIVNDLAEAQR